MRASSFSSFFAAAGTAVAISACSGLVHVGAPCDADGGACTPVTDAGPGGDGGGRVGDACFTDSDCASPARCMYQAPGFDSPGALCGSQGICQQEMGCGIDCAEPVQYIGCDCAGHSVSACQCPNNGYSTQQYSVVFGAPTTAFECPNDPPALKDAGPAVGFDAGASDGGDLNATGSLMIDSFKCTLTSSVRQTQSAPDGDTWTLDMEASCPVAALGQVSVYVVGKDNVTYPYGCNTSASMQLSVGGEGDAGFLAYDGQNAGGSCTVNDGPLASFEANKVRAMGTLSNGAAKTHSVDVVEP
jgi:hypothetical protein